MKNEILITERETMFYPELDKDDSLALHTDLYEINMMYTYFKKGIADRNAVLKLFIELSHSATVMLFMLVWNTSLII